ncbi:hypothetical protein MNBD_ALPHA11-1117 [hydrothermal vent metagenome]|uniref:Uncharacterized protein n=1 Tax=hydrothermal vent metagenome TaxID=652676 RepID=A0A3B0TNB0_9ZZZZ
MITVANNLVALAKKYGVSGPISRSSNSPAKPEASSPVEEFFAHMASSYICLLFEAFSMIFSNFGFVELIVLLLSDEIHLMRFA